MRINWAPPAKTGSEGGEEMRSGDLRERRDRNLKKRSNHDVAFKSRVERDVLKGARTSELPVDCRVQPRRTRSSLRPHVGVAGERRTLPRPDRRARQLGRAATAKGGLFNQAAGRLLIFNERAKCWNT